MGTGHIRTICLALLTVALLFIDPNAAAFCALGTVASYKFGDGELTKTRALPSGASAVTSTAIDLGEDTTGTFVTDCELVINAPAVTTGMLGDAATIKYDIVTSDTSDLTTSPTIIAKEVIVQTGAGGAGAAATEARFRFPTNVKRYVGVRATKSATGDASSVSMTVALRF